MLVCRLIFGVIFVPKAGAILEASSSTRAFRYVALGFVQDESRLCIILAWLWCIPICPRESYNTVALLHLINQSLLSYSIENRNSACIHREFVNEAISELFVRGCILEVPLSILSSAIHCTLRFSLPRNSDLF